MDECVPPGGFAQVVTAACPYQKCFYPIYELQFPHFREENLYLSINMYDQHADLHMKGFPPPSAEYSSICQYVYVILTR